MYINKEVKNGDSFNTIDLRKMLITCPHVNLEYKITEEVAIFINSIQQNLIAGEALYEMGEI